MKKALASTQQNFESSSGRTPQYLSWHRLFKKELTAFLISVGCTEIKIGKPNHFDMSGFFRSSTGQIWYFSVSDIRWSEDKMLIRSAKSFTDYSGGMNQYVSLTRGEDAFKERLIAVLAMGERTLNGDLVNDINVATLRYISA